jgi:dTDP-4-dehydrorhamnose 3,5-epimerase
VLRGLHYQLSPFSQTKLVRVVRGSVIDIVVDIRKSSPTFSKIFSIELTAQNKKQLLVPKGFAHGFVVLEDNTIFSYKCDELYNKESERGINPFDKSLSIDWGISKELAILSEKDLNSPSFTNAEYNFSF